jgi:hypothetical protein
MDLGAIGILGSRLSGDLIRRRTNRYTVVAAEQVAPLVKESPQFLQGLVPHYRPIMLRPRNRIDGVAIEDFLCLGAVI